MKTQILEFLKKPRFIDHESFSIIESIFINDFDDKNDIIIRGQFERYTDTACGNNPDEDSSEQYARLVKIESIDFECKQFNCSITDIDSIFTEDEKQLILNSLSSIKLV